MELRHVRAFLAVAKERNFTRAAERVHLSQPAFSRVILQLEAELGMSLLERTKRSVALTEAGQVFLEHARKAAVRRGSSGACACAPETCRWQDPGSAHLRTALTTGVGGLCRFLSPVP